MVHRVYWLDSAVACLVAVSILVTGTKLIRQAFLRLMDTSEPDLLEEIARILAQHRKDAWIDIHRLRARRAGRQVLLDFHLILPRDLTLAAAHREVKELEGILNTHFGGQADILIHTDPCEEPVCSICGHDPCQLRQEETLVQRIWQSKVLTTEAEDKQDILTKTEQEQAGKTQE
jgi:divalent metal cation (Fe/Co/Zn/Cd) transporter